MPCTITLSKKFTDNRLAGECRESDGGDELITCWSDDHLNLRPLLNQLADDEARLIRSDAARDTKYYFLALQHDDFSL